MAKVRGSAVYKKLKRPYTRKSKYKQHMYIRGGIPAKRTVKFDMGDINSNYPLRLSLFTLQEGTLLDNALEASRQTANKYLLKCFGGKQSGFYFKIKVFPHHIVRIHPIAMGAGADRYSTGMARAYGKPTNLGARVKAGHEIMFIEIPVEKEAIAREALRKAKCKIPFKSFIEITKRPKIAAAPKKE
jgi:large subunit ribosomal protein L10e